MSTRFYLPILFMLLFTFTARADMTSASIELPKDEATHQDPIEWHYVTGHLFGARGSEYGFEIVFFQLQNPDASFTRVAQVAVTDLKNLSFHHQTYVEPGGYNQVPNAFHLEVNAGASTYTAATGTSSAMYLFGAVDDYRLVLNLRALSPAIYQANNGLVTYAGSSETTNYFSRQRMLMKGEIETASGNETVVGEAWFDHEFGQLPFVAWDWLSIQLRDGKNIMVTQIRDGNTGAPLAKFGNFNGEPLSADDFSIDFSSQPSSLWTSPHTSITYPTRSYVHIPSKNVDLSLIAQLADQELYNNANVFGPYWEGSVSVCGTVDGRDVEGLGYVEMTGRK